MLQHMNAVREKRNVWESLKPKQNEEIVIGLCREKRMSIDIFEIYQLTSPFHKSQKEQRERRAREARKRKRKSVCVGL